MSKLINVIMLGNLKSMGVIYNTIGKANQIQTSYNFEIYSKKSNEQNLQIGNYKLQNGGYDFLQLCENIVNEYHFNNHTIFITCDPFSTKEQGDIPEEFYFHHNNTQLKYSIVSTYLWDNLNSSYSLQSYLLMQLGLIILEINTDIGIHTETRGCVCDYCDNVADILGIFKNNGFCNECEAFIHNQFEKKNLSLDALISAKRLINRALLKKICFVAIPYQERYFQIFEYIKDTLSTYMVCKGDENLLPQKINDGILLNISLCDLFIAEISNRNPNVYFEVGLAQNKFCEVVLLSNKREIPFDLKMSRVIIYKDKDELNQKIKSLLCNELK